MQLKNSKNVDSSEKKTEIVFVIIKTPKTLKYHILFGM